MLETPEGKRVLGRILENANIYKTTLVVGSFEHSAFLEGFRHSGNMLANTIREISPMLLAECEIAVIEFEKAYNQGEDLDQ